MATLTGISTCTATTCSFNADDACTAPAITVAGSPDHAECGTFISLDVRGGLPTASAHVGACQRVECTHNKDLLCSAESVTIGAGADTADCLTYSTD
ncbi:DUF1540 domain-containing protein [Dietzia sp. PP-33]|jgi:hypothetical protein|uniref:DUF1540 domain-containing protein n=1 Tax=Dietzia sp. PP-33 TaxID=2957500 RepID=UPI0029B16731|nr:DUF1540 domain-containing protein [Dietzia sp. PP-33]MDX2358027.1 DUF1540 domain-containing protein [Dietzia sp. PP-33]